MPWRARVSGAGVFRSRAPEVRTVLFLSPTASLATIEASRCTPESSKVCTDDELRSITIRG